MGSPESIDFDLLLKPISDGSPVGEDPRADEAHDSPYRELVKLRNDVKNAEKAIALGDSPRVDIPTLRRKILDECQEFLVKRAKDLEVTAWLIEALVREHGFAGLRDGLRLTRELAERFWDNLYPEEDETDGMALRVAALRGLFGVDVEGRLIALIGKLALTAGAAGGAYSYHDYQSAEDLEAVENPDIRARRIEQGALTLEAFENAARSTPSDHYDQLLADIASAQHELEQLGTTLHERCPPLPDGEQVAPSVANVRNILSSCGQTIRMYHKPITTTSEEGGGKDVPSAPGREPNVHAEINSREEAFRILLRVADYFKRTEPHSPLSYALEQSVRWGRLPLPKLWSELIPSDSDREQVFKLVGIMEEANSESN